jgi:23S rRNA (adenine2503-C2)-methyltransferase
MDLMMDDFSYGISKRRVTLSTSGVVPRLYDLAGVSDVSLAVSLHAPNDALRDQLVPINKKYPIKELMKACQHYMASLPDRRKLTIEYTMMDKINDEMVHAEELAVLLKDTPCKINLIPFNPFPNSGYERPSNNRVYKFRDYLHQQGYIVTIRSTRGDDIDAACGQLVGNVEDRTKRSARYIKMNDITNAADTTQS